MKRLDHRLGRASLMATAWHRHPSRIRLSLLPTRNSLVVARPAPSAQPRPLPSAQPRPLPSAQPRPLPSAQPPPHLLRRRYIRQRFPCRTAHEKPIWSRRSLLSFQPPRGLKVALGRLLITSRAASNRFHDVMETSRRLLPPPVKMPRLS